MYPTAIGAHHMRTGANVLGRLEEASRPAGPRLNDAGLPAYSVVPPPEVRLFPELLRRAGYFTTNNLKTDYQLDAPVTTWDEDGPTASYRHRPAGQPFFSVFNFAITHEMMMALRKNEPLRIQPDQVIVPPIYPDTPAVRADMARMHTFIQIMDQQVGELIQQLKDDGVYDNTVIFFFSDHGGVLPWMKREVTERGTHIPLILRWPQQQHGGTVDGQLISGVDLAPTVLSLAGVPIPAFMQGQAFLGGQKAPQPRSHVFAARDRMDERHDRVRSVRDLRYRYVYNHLPGQPFYQDIQFRIDKFAMLREMLDLRDQGQLPAATAGWFKTKPIEELYDLERDPWEMNNLATDAAQQTKLLALRQALLRWHQQYPDLGDEPEAAMIRRMWNGADTQPVTAMPEVTPVAGGVKLACATPGCVMGYRVTNPAGAAAAPRQQVVQSWDFAVYLGLKNGVPMPAPAAWRIYQGEVIALQPAEVLEVNAQRIGYQAATLAYRGTASP
jgi:arylsulfatase A-like enzyme